MGRTVSFRGKAAGAFLNLWKQAQKDEPAPPAKKPTILSGDDLDNRPAVVALLRRIKKKLPRLEEILAECDDEWGLEDNVYRYYHGSFKVYGFQDLTLKIVKELKALCPRSFVEDDRWLGAFHSELDPRPPRFRKRRLDTMFEEIVKAGTGKTFHRDHNNDWTLHTRPIVEAFFHAYYFLRMMVKYGKEMDAPPSMLPSGWAAVLYLYGLR